MTRITFLLFFLIATLSSCDEDEEKGFWHTDESPDVTMTSMIPYPWSVEDAVANNIYYMNGDGYGSFVRTAWSGKFIDINKDDKLDFRFEVKHSFDTQEDGQSYDEFVIYIAAWNDDEVSLADLPKGSVKKYQPGDRPDYDSFGKAPIRYQVDNGGYLIRIDLHDNLAVDEDFYIALKMMIDGKLHYGWAHVETKVSPLTLTIKEYALSKAVDRQIVIGQK